MALYLCLFNIAIYGSLFVFINAAIYGFVFNIYTDHLEINQVGNSSPKWSYANLVVILPRGVLLINPS